MFEHTSADADKRRIVGYNNITMCAIVSLAIDIIAERSYSRLEVKCFRTVVQLTVFGGEVVVFNVVEGGVVTGLGGKDAGAFGS